MSSSVICTYIIHLRQCIHIWYWPSFLIIIKYLDTLWINVLISCSVIMYCALMILLYRPCIWINCGLLPWLGPKRLHHLLLHTWAPRHQLCSSRQPDFPKLPGTVGRSSGHGGCHSDLEVKECGVFGVNKGVTVSTLKGVFVCVCLSFSQAISSIFQ